MRLGRLKVLGALASVLAAAGLIQSCTTRDVIAVVVGSVAVNPSIATVVAGDSARFTAEVRADDGTALSAALVTWSSDNPSVLSVDGTGMAHGLAAGAASVRASFRGTSGSAAVTVVAGPSIAVDPTSVTFTGAVADVAPPPQSVQVTNGGGGTLTGLLAAVQFQAGQATGWLDATLASSSAPTSITLTPTVGLLPAGTYNATVVLSAQGASNSPVSIPVTLTLTQDRPVIHLSPSPVSLQGEAGGSPVTTTVQVTNAGGGALTNLSSSVWYETAGGWLSANLSGTDAPATLTVTTDPSGLTAGTYRGEIRVASPVAVTSPVALPVTFVVGQAADVSVVKSGPTSAVQGDTITYTVQAHNAGPEAADGVVVTDTLPGGVTFLSSTGGTVSNGVLAWSVGSMAPGATTGINLAVIVGGGTTGIVTNQAHVSSTTPDPDLANNTSSVSTAIGALILSNLSVTKTGPATALGGDRITYDLAVSNAGPNGAQGVTLVDTIPVGMTFVSSTAGTESGGVLTWSVGSMATTTTQNASVVVDIDPATRGTVTNRAWVRATTVDLTPTDDSSAVSTDVGAPPGFAISESAGATVVSENLTTDTFTVVLTAQPASSVVFTVVSGDLTEATVSPATLTFTNGNWNVPQSVVVTGVDDAIIDGNQVSTVTVAVDTAASDSAFDPLPAQYVSVTTQDNDSPGLTLSPKSLSVNESGTTATFSVVLNTQPTNNVVLTVTSGDLTEATVSPATLTFTHGNWKNSQTVTVTGVDDFVDDGNQISPVAVAVDVGNSDATYASVPPDTVSVTTVDNDAAGFTITDVSSPTVSESGTTYQFNVKLTSQPTSNVVLSVTSSDTGEATVSPDTLTFDGTNWNVPQTVTVTGVDDSVVDGPQVSTVTVSVVDALSDDTFDPLADQTRLVTTTDNETAGFTVTGGPLTVSEAGTTGTFTVVLTAQPVSNVVFNVTSSDTGEATVSPVTLTFTPGNWSTPQTDTVTGVDDALVDGPQTSTITVSVNDALSQDQFDPLADKTVSVTTTDNETAGFTVSPTSLSVAEGSTNTFTVVLTGQPVSNVAFTVTGSDATEATASPGTLTFTNGNWNTPQTVTVTGVVDGIVDGNQVSTITVAVNAAGSQAEFDTLAAKTVSVTTLDANTAGFTVSADSLTVSESGTTADFTVLLTAPPVDSVVFNLSSNDISEAAVSPARLTFKSGNWSTPQTATVTGVDDAIVDGTQYSKITVAVDASSDLAYKALAADSVIVATLDNDAASFTVTQTGGTTVATEGGATDTITVKLNTAPASNVVLKVASSDATDATATPTTLTFSSANYNTPQVVTVAAVNDAVIDGNRTDTITVSVDTLNSDPTYKSVPAQKVNVTTIDNDAPGLAITQSGGTTVASESGTTDTIKVALTSQPMTSVVLDVASSKPADATAAPTPLTFTNGNWSTPQNVIVTAVNDAIPDGNQIDTVTISVNVGGSDATYASVSPQEVPVTTIDNDIAGFTVTPTNGTTTVNESGTLDTINVVLNAQPTSDVVLTVTSGDLTEATVSPATLTFTSANWNTTQTVVVTGVDDFVADGNQITAVTFAVDTANSASAYDAVPSQSVNVTTVDNDVAGFTLHDSTGATVNEVGGTPYLFTVVLTSQPLSNVVLSVTSGDLTEATVSPATLTFTSANWNTPQLVTVSGVDDPYADGNKLTTITVSVVDALSDNTYDPLADQTRSVTTVDNEIAGFSVSQTNGSTTVSESGSKDTINVVLTAQPETPVVFDVGSSDTGEAAVAPATLTFDSTNWSTPQPITVTGVDDALVDGPQTSTVTVSMDAATQSPFNALAAKTVSVTTLDNETAGFTVDSSSVTVVEGATTSFTVVLTGQPQSNVVFDVGSSDATASTVSPTTLTFTNGNWNTPQTVTVMGTDDPTVDGSQTSTVTVSPNGSSQVPFDTLTAKTVSVTTTDNDVAGFSVSPTTLSVAEGASTSFTVVLTAQPLTNVVFNVGSNDTSASTVSPATLTFTYGNWNTPQTVTVSGVDNHIIDGNRSSTDTVSVDASSDAAFTGLAAKTVSVTTTNVDVAGFAVDSTSMTVAEGASKSFNVVLTARPATNVVFNVSSDDATASTVDKPTLTFTNGNWDTPQTVTVTGVADGVVDPDQSSTITTSVDVSSDPDFKHLADQTVSVTTTNVDLAGFAVDSTSMTVDEGASETFTVVLTGKPATNVVFNVASDDTNKSTVSPTTLTFTNGDWNTPQTVTVTGSTVTQNETSHITVSVDGTSDPGFTGLAAQQVTVTTVNVALDELVERSPSLATADIDAPSQSTAGWARAATDPQGLRLAFAPVGAPRVEDGTDLSRAVRAAPR